VAADYTPLMLPLATRVSWEVEQRLVANSSADERLLRQAFVAARNRTKGAVLALSERTTMANGAAAAIVRPGDRDLLWGAVAPMLAVGLEGSLEVPLTGERTVRGHWLLVHDGARVVGAVVRLEPESARESVARFGWASVTDTERAVANLIAQGLTNREAADRLFLSAHTVDFHLRQLYRKLDLHSRVELTKALLLERH
jgi:DNA-binding CsgD family transcriptional regulator